ncbi:MAG: competence protein ComEC family protein, partial [Oscillospiraceae bacterium]|nr:competence protein ComEC family protein [Oscillospiraceae bacterium]
MVRKMAYIGSSYLIGLFFASFLPCGINIFASAGIIISAVGALIVFGKKYSKQMICVICGAAAMFIYGFYEAAVYKNIVKYDGYDVKITGTVSEYAEHSGDKASYIVKGVINDDVRAEVMFYTDSSDAEIGDVITVSGIAEKLKDKYTFPAEEYYKSKGIYLRINKITDFSCTKNTGFSLRKMLDRYREYIIGKIDAVMDKESMAIMSAMLFGDKSDLESTEKTLLYRAGIGHIMAVSGVHISVVCAFFWAIVSSINAGKYLRFVLIMLPVFCFAMLAGMSNSVIRAAVMAAVVYGAELFRRRADTYNS